MALIRCKECGNEVSSKSKKCPNCGCPIKKNSVINVLLSIFIIIIILILMGIFASMNSTTNNINKTNQNEFICQEAINYAYSVLLQDIKNDLKNPESLQVHSNKVSSFMYDNKEGKTEFSYSLEELKQIYEENPFEEYYINFIIDMSAQNGFGGYNRKQERGQVLVKKENGSINFYSYIQLQN